MLPTYLRIAYGGLNSRSPFLGNMPKVVSYFFKRPTYLSRSMGEVMPQVMDGKIMNQFPLAFVARALSARNQ